MVADNVNGMFEVVGGLFVAANVLRLYRDKKVRGVSRIATAFFVVWGYWNLYYYAAIGQWWSQAGALSAALVNSVWLGQMVYYTRKEKRDGSEQPIRRR